jgi:hypothetical protein
MKGKEMIVDFDDAQKLRVVTAGGGLTWAGTAPQIVRDMARGDWEAPRDSWSFMKNVQRRIEDHFDIGIRVKRGNCTKFLRELERIGFVQVKPK